MKFLVFLIPFFLFASKPKLLLLKEYKEQNVTGWVMSEKLDGIRAYWDGGKLLTRNGKVIHAPKWFTKDYPNFPLDGELWSKENDFENISSIVRDKTPSAKWNQIKHYIFEAPNANGNLLERLEKVKNIKSKYIKLIPQIVVKDKLHLKKFLKKVEAKKGEGVVVRNPNLEYERGRSKNALKVKTFQDAECEVLDHFKGKGKFQNVLGSLKCKLTNGITFKIGSGFSKKERQIPPQIGSIITFKHQNFTKYGKPRFPVFLREKK